MVFSIETHPMEQHLRELNSLTRTPERCALVESSVSICLALPTPAADSSS